MKWFVQLVALLIAVAMAIAAFVGLGRAWGYLAAHAVEWSMPIGADAAAPALATLLAALLIARSLSALAARDRANQFQEQKETAYRLLADVHVAVIAGLRLAAPPRAEIAEARQSLDRLLTLYGSPAVLRADAALRDLERADAPVESAMRAELGRALLAIRRDLGIRTASVTADDLQRLLCAALDEEDCADRGAGRGRLARSVA